MSYLGMGSKVLCFCVLALAVACASSFYYRGTYQLEHGQLDEAVANLEKARKDSPTSIRIQTTLVRAKLAASAKHMENAKFSIAREDYEMAALQLTLVLKYDPGNQRAQDMLGKVLTAQKDMEDKARAAALSIDQMKQAYEEETGVPKLDPASNIPIVLKFTDTPIKTILDAISKASGINFIYDEKTETSKRVTVDFSKVNLSEVMDYLMMQTKNFYKVLDPHTLMVIPDNKQKRDEYTDQVIRTFYLSNSDAKDVFQLVRSILQARKMAMNQDLNSITIQDSPDVVAICQKIIEENDKSKGEVIVDVELLEVDTNNTLSLGMDLSSHQFTIGPGTNVTKDSSGNVTGIGTGPPVPLNKFGQILSHNLWITPVPNLIVNLMLSDSTTTVLAKPQLRVLEGQKASVHIGDKLPIPTANTYATGSVTTNYTPITSYTYQDIGVKIEIEPKVHHNREVTIKLKAEVSAQTGVVPASGLNPAQPIIGTRETSSVIRLQDGETSLLAGLIQKTDKDALSGIPGIANIPILRRLFSQTDRGHQTTDVVLLLTPHIIRMPNITPEDIKPIWVGTADNPRLKGDPATSWAPSPFLGPLAKQPAKTGKAEGLAKGAPAGTEAKKDAISPNTSGTGQSASQAAPTGDTSQDQKPAAGPEARVMVSPTTVNVKAGETATMNLVAVGGADIKDMHVEADFPSDILKFQGADEGTFLKMGGGATTFSAMESKPGNLILDMGRADGAAAGAGLLGRVRFTALKAGQAQVNFRVVTARGATGLSARLAPIQAAVSVSDPGGQTGAPQPAPAGDDGD